MVTKRNTSEATDNAFDEVNTNSPHHGQDSAPWPTRAGEPLAPVAPGAGSRPIRTFNPQLIRREDSRRKTLDELLDDYVMEYHKAATTAWNIRRFLKWIFTRPPFLGRPYTTLPVECLNATLVTEYMNELDELVKAKQLKLKTAEGYKYDLGPWFRLLHAKRYIEDYSDLIKVTRPPIKSSLRIFDLDHLEQIIKLAKKMAPLRIFAGFCLAAATAARSCELARLSMDDVDLKERTITYIGKGGSPRTIPLPDVLIPVLSEYLSTRPESVSNAFFVNSKGLSHSEKSMDDRLNRYLARIIKSLAVPTKGRGFHTFRHILPTQLVQQGVDPEDIAPIMGIKQLKSLQIYLDIGSYRISRELNKHFPLR